MQSRIETADRMSKAVIIIPNYNGLHFMEPCIRALEAQTCKDFELLVVDNASTDGSVEYLQALGARETAFPVRCLYLRENLGFAGGVNAGIAAVLEPESTGAAAAPQPDGTGAAAAPVPYCSGTPDYIILLNNDTEAAPDYVEALLRTMDQDTGHKLFAVSPLMLQLCHPELIDDAGDGYTLIGWGFQRGVGQPAGAAAFAEAKSVFSACAGAAVYRSEHLRKLRLREGEYFDNMHFAYLEDIDISFRARTRGWKVLYEPAARVLHVGSGTSGSRYNSFKVRLAARNNVWLNYKNMSLPMLLLNLPWIFAGLLIKQLFFIRRGFGGDYFKGFIEGIRRLPEVSKNRTGFRISFTPHRIVIEFLLLRDLLSYTRDFLVRHLRRTPPRA